ncbi:hypothetical protein [Rhodococcus sp. RD6.2]|nr:hypothetical protein [Rhodococcus sp. RD6.2]
MNEGRPTGLFSHLDDEVTATAISIEDDERVSRPVFSGIPADHQHGDG